MHHRYPIFRHFPHPEPKVPPAHCGLSLTPAAPQVTTEISLVPCAFSEHFTRMESGHRKALPSISSLSIMFLTVTRMHGPGASALLRVAPDGCPAVWESHMGSSSCHLVALGQLAASHE